MKRILFLNPVSEMGGAEKVLISWISKLKTLHPEYEIHLLVPGFGSLPTQAQALGVHIHTLPFPRALAQYGDSGGIRFFKLVSLLISFLFPIGYLKYFSSFNQIIKQIQPNLIHSNGMKTHIMSSLAELNSTPVIWHLHDFVSSRLILRNLLSFFSKKSKVCICVSNLVATDAHKSGFKCSTTVIRNGVDLKQFVPGPKTNDDVFRIGLIATYAKWKGQDVFIEAAAMTLECHPHHKIHFYIVGGPIYQTQGSQFSRKELEDLIQKHRLNDSMTLIPFEKNILSIYHDLDCVVHASTRPEPFGLTIAEAMACGKTVIASPTTGALENGFTPGHDAAILCEPNPNTLAKAFSTVLENELFRNALKIEARTYAELHFSLDQSHSELEKIYQMASKP